MSASAPVAPVDVAASHAVNVATDFPSGAAFSVEISTGDKRSRQQFVSLEMSHTPPDAESPLQTHRLWLSARDLDGFAALVNRAVDEARRERVV